MPRPFPVLDGPRDAPGRRTGPEHAAASPHARTLRCRVPRPRIARPAPPETTARVRLRVANYIRRMILDRFLVTDQVAIVTGQRARHRRRHRGGAGRGGRRRRAGRPHRGPAARRGQAGRGGRPAGHRRARRPDRLRPHGLPGRDGVQRAGPPRHRRQQHGRHHAPAAARHVARASWREAFRFNVSAGHALVRAAVPRMLEGEHPGGAIVSISSVMGHVAGRGYLGYGTVKGALEQYTRLASRDLAPRIRVNAIGVGSTATSALDIVMSSDELRTAMEEATPLKRLGPRRRHRLGHPLPRLARRRLRHRQDHRGRRRPAVAQPRDAPPRPLRRHPHAVPRRAVEHRQRRAPCPGRHRRPSRARAGRALRLEPRQGGPRRRRAGRRSAARSAWPGRATSTPCSPSSPTASCTPPWPTTASSRPWPISSASWPPASTWCPRAR